LILLALVGAWQASAQEPAHVGAGPAASPGDATARARAHYDIGLGLYNLGNYEEALREFSAGYALSPLPGFLINLGQAYRKLHQPAKAKEMWQHYLDQVSAEDPFRPRVRELLSEVERETTPPPPSPSLPGATAATAAAPRPITAPAQAGHLRRNRLLAVLLPVTAAVLAGVAIGVYFAARPSDCGSVGAGYCYDLRR
jgi:tetratricopeptide (TPR) repeat protein